MKGKILIPSALIVALLFAITLFVKIGNFSFSSIWFSVLIFYLGIYSLIYSYSYKLDSAFYYGVLLILFTFASAYRFFTGIEYREFYPIYMLCFALSHLAVFVFFRQYIHFKLFAFLAIECILLISYKTNFITIWGVITLNAIFILYLLFNITYRLRKNLRRR